MSISTTTYVRKPIYVDAVQVTEQNFDQISKWCDGEIKETMSLRNKPVKYIHVPVTRPQTERQEQARVGDWILTSERGYKVYTPKAFSVAFDKVNDVPAKSYPYPDGNTLVLGPQIFAGGGDSLGSPDDRTVISWKGENFYTPGYASELTATTGVNSNPNQASFETEPVVAEHRAMASDIRNQAAAGKMTAEEAEMKIARLPQPVVAPVGSGPMPKQPMPNVDPASTPDANINPGPPKAADVWARVERGEINDVQARQILGLSELTPAERFANDIPEYLCNTCMRAKRRDSVGEFCVECRGLIVSREDVIGQQAVGTQPMPPQPEPTDVEVRERPVSLPPNMQSGGYAENVETGERTEAVHIPVDAEKVAHTNAEVAALKVEQGVPVVENTTNEGVETVSTPEDPNTHVGVDLTKDEALKAGIDLTDETALKAADDDAQLAADAMIEEEN